jgi:hypothetical protein
VLHASSFVVPEPNTQNPYLSAFRAQSFYMQRMVLDLTVQFFFYELSYLTKVAEFHFFHFIASSTNEMMMVCPGFPAQAVIKPAVMMLDLYQNTGTFHFFQDTVNRRQPHFEEHLPEHPFYIRRPEITFLSQKKPDHRFSAGGYLEMVAFERRQIVFHFNSGLF